MIFKIPYLFSLISSLLLLEPGNVIATGTLVDISPLSPDDVDDPVIEGIDALSYVVSGVRPKLLRSS